MRILLTIFMGILLFPAFCAAMSVTIVQSSKAQPYQEAVTSLAKELKDLGFKNKSRVMNLQLLEQEKEPLLHGSGDDIFVAIGTKAALFLGKFLPQEVTLTYCMVANVDELKLSGAIRGTGVSTDIPPEAQVKLLKEAMPNIRAIGMLYRSDNVKSRQGMVAVHNALPKSWELKSINVATSKSISEAIKSLCKEKIDIIWTHSDASVYTPAVIRSLLLTSLRKRIPVFGYSVPFVQAGALLGTGINPGKQGKEVAQIISQHLAAGSNESDLVNPLGNLPFVSEFEIAVNLIVAKNLSLNVPNSIIEKATYVYRAD